MSDHLTSRQISSLYQRAFSQHSPRILNHSVLSAYLKTGRNNSPIPLGHRSFLTALLPGGSDRKLKQMERQANAAPHNPSLEAGRSCRERSISFKPDFELCRFCELDSIYLVC